MFVSYAQNFEDVLLHRVFGGQETGFYVDVGAYDPVDGSVTKALYDRGWSGINIEPASIHEVLAAARPRDINLRMAVWDHAGEVPFFEDAADRGMSRVVDGPRDGAVMVPCDTLEAIVARHASGRRVDVLKVDAEGAEAAIVGSTDWRAFRPRVVLIEAARPWSNTLVNEAWEPVLLEQGYARVYFDGINCFYLPEEEVATLGRHFRVPVNALDRVKLYDRAAEAAAGALEDARAELAKARATIADAAAGPRPDAAAAEAARARIVALTTEVTVLRAEHERANGEFSALRAARDGAQADLAALRLTHDETRRTLEEQQEAAARLAVENEAWVAAHDALAAERAALMAERASLLAASDGAEAHRPGPASPASEPAPQGPARHPRPPLTTARGAALAAYAVVRPVVRPIAWRVRGFLIGGVEQRLHQIGADQQAARQEIHALQGAIASELHDRTRGTADPPLAAPRGPDAGEERMRRLAEEIERALLTLAMDSARPGLAEPTSSA